MARAEVASASSVSSDSIKGLAQSIAKPAYRRLLTAEPALRRAVPALIIAFLLTIAVGAVVQIFYYSQQAMRAPSNGIETIAEVLSDRLDRTRRDDKTNDWRRAQESLIQATTKRTIASGRQILVSNAEGLIVAAAPSPAGIIGRNLLDIMGETQPLTILAGEA